MMPTQLARSSIQLSSCFSISNSFNSLVFVSVMVVLYAWSELRNILLGNEAKWEGYAMRTRKNRATLVEFD
jgi:hypothetical protein